MRGDVDVPYVSYTLEGDDGKSLLSFCPPAIDGWFYIKTSLNCQGFVHLKATACDEDQKEIDGVDIFEGGAGAEVESITSGSEIPDDYFQFWDRLKSEIEETEPKVIYKKEFYPYPS